ncbi:hypothetical protein D0869_15017 [Hortaea werneckii]|uniref:DNA (cytosine-5)-methyltransferase 1 replication foci domain-containing protein n=2 Tax=Hortaea werneckii TaxID=91943 RepID=A0A3M6W0H7_HORWE|nr:hypothetical protein KC324_g7942 [Hortaea werneckii]RMX72044.1 hypothetical protein D0869_15017 [Hortaea werneckii]
MSQGQPHPESALLTPLHPVHDANPDDWPEYDVTNARVTPPDSDDLVPLLSATEHYPLVLTGSLQPLPDKYRNRYIGQGTRRSDTIQVPDVRLFAYGQYADGSVVLWAAGQAGWYTIKPARPYRSIYTRMVEGVKMLYFVADMYREERKQGKGKNATPLPPYTAEELFEQYALEMWDDASRSEEARGMIEDHRDFLITSMLGGKEGMDWRKNPLYLYFKKTFPQEHDAVLYRIAGPGKKSTAAQRVVRQQSVDSTSTSSSLKRKRGRPRRDESLAGSVAGDASASQTGRKKATDVISLDSSSTTTRSGSRRAAAASAKPRTQPSRGTSQTTRNSAPPTRRTRHTPDAPLTDAGGLPNPSPSQPSEHEVTTPKAETSDSDDEVTARQARKGRSSLRLKPSASGGKSAKAASKGGKGKAPALPDLNRDPDDEEESEDELNSSPTQKRQPESPPPPPSRHRKRGTSHPHHQPHDPTTTDPAFSSSNPTNNPPNQTAHLPPTPSTSSSSPPPSPPLAPPTSDPSHLNHTADPLQENTWTCALDGCTHKIYLASDPASQRLIRDHYKLHAYDDDERVRLVGRLQAPSLPVGHLMERVRLVARRRDGEGRDGSRDGDGDGDGDVGGGAEEEVDERKIGRKREDVVEEAEEEAEVKGRQGNNNKVERAKMPSSRYPPPAPAPTAAAAAIEPIVQRY